MAPFEICMLQDRIFSTIKFFDLQDYPVTLLEVHKFLLAELEDIKNVTNEFGEVLSGEREAGKPVPIGEILPALVSLSGVSCTSGFYSIMGREYLVQQRLSNYQFGIKREKIIQRFVWLFKYIPFVRGVALGGSQALGMQKQSSDIDLLVFTEQGFLWLARTLVTAYFQSIGKRRHGMFIANRFCLNHYLALPREVHELKNLYTALEYGRLRPLVFTNVPERFVFNNRAWVQQLFPNIEFIKPVSESPHGLQRALEFLFDNSLGKWIEKRLKAIQLPKIRTGEKFIVVHEDELSFHPDSKQEGLLKKFI